MFERVLIAEDHDNTSRSLKQALIDLGVKDPIYVSYCDQALSWIKKAVKKDQPYDLLITDLSFEDDYTSQEITDGITLIKAVKGLQPDLKILVFSAEGRPVVTGPLIREIGIDGYVRKARKDIDELKAALEAIANGKTYFSAQIRQSALESNSFSFTAYDTIVIRLLAGGVKQKEIPAYLQKNKIVPAGLSSLEKRLGLIRDVFGFSTNEQLIAYCKDFQVI